MRLLPMRSRRVVGADAAACQRVAAAHLAYGGQCSLSSLMAAPKARRKRAEYIKLVEAIDVYDAKRWAEGKIPAVAASR
jgi:hypothetical protein